MSWKTGFLAFVAIAAVAVATPHKVELAFETLALKNGKTLPNGTVRSYDPASGNVVVMSGRSIVSLQIELLPDEVAARIAALVPSESKDEARAAREERRRTAQEQKKQNERGAARAAAEAARAKDARQARQHESQEELRQAKISRAAREAAAARARRYFTYESKPGSGATVTVRREVEVEEPVPVTGWPDRYRVKGSIGLEYYDSKGRSFNNSIRDFEVIVQGDERGNVKVVDFSPR